MADTYSAAITFCFQGDTRFLLRKDFGSVRSFPYPLERRASIKDIIESLGVPHTEVGRIVVSGREKSFAYIPTEGEHLDIYPLNANDPPTKSSVLRPEPLEQLAFLVDVNVAKLGNLMRMAGFDAAPVVTESLHEIAASLSRSPKIVLSRNRELLRLKDVIFGRLLRSEDPFVQFQEIVDLYDLKEHMHPFTRCMRCNGVLEPVAKEAILDRLEPLTKKYYNTFKQCPDCGHIYWHGSHLVRMERTLAKLTGDDSYQAKRPSLS